MSVDRIMRVQEEHGSHALEYGLYLGISGMIGAMLGVTQAESDVGGEVNGDAKLAIVGGLTALCALVGVAMGSSQKKYRTVYANPKFDALAGRPPEEFHPAGDGVSLSMSHRF